MPTPTAAQIDTFLNFLDEHREFARGNLRSVEGRLLSQRLWQGITEILNGMGGCTKTTVQWQKVWTDKKIPGQEGNKGCREICLVNRRWNFYSLVIIRVGAKVLSIMGDGYGGRQTTARTPAFIEHASPGTSALATAASTSIKSHQADVSEVNVQPLDNIPTSLQTPATSPTFQQLDNIKPGTSLQAPATPVSATTIMHPQPHKLVSVTI